MFYLIVASILFFLLSVYFVIAEKFSIIDRPNERSSHTSLTIRGGGIIFLISIIAAGLLYPTYFLPVIGAVIIGAISFADDRITLSSKVRIVFHLLSVTLLFYFLPLFGVVPIIGIIALYVLVIGIINAYNFMDGINGITGLYSLVVMGGLQVVNLYFYSFIEPDLIWFPMISCIVFLFFNFRKKAKCFAGDVGSVTIAFWILFLLLKLVLETGKWEYILFLAVYGVDSVLTIVHRLILRQNIFDAHRLHFYQILANERKISHLLVSSLYALVQVIIISFIVLTDIGLVQAFLVSTLPLVAIYLTKPALMKVSA